MRDLSSRLLVASLALMSVLGAAACDSDTATRPSHKSSRGPSFTERPLGYDGTLWLCNGGPSSPTGVNYSFRVTASGGIFQYTTEDTSRIIERPVFDGAGPCQGGAALFYVQDGSVIHVTVDELLPNQSGATPQSWRLVFDSPQQHVITTAGAMSSFSFDLNTTGGVNGITFDYKLAVTNVSASAAEPAYDSTAHHLILRDGFDNYASINGTAPTFRSRYPVYRTLGFAEEGIPITDVVSLVTGRNGSGKALRLAYGSPGGASDIVVGPETRLSYVGQFDESEPFALDGTMPEVAGPYTHFFLTTWFRLSSGADPAAYDGNGIKGFMLWNAAGGRYQNAVSRLVQDGETRGPRGANPDNAQSGMSLYQTAGGRAPLFSDLADGQWHRFTVEVFAGSDPSGHVGERFWVDGVLAYSDVDIDVGPGTTAGHYSYGSAITHWAVWGNYINGVVAQNSPFFTVDFDEWVAWTPK